MEGSYMSRSSENMDKDSSGKEIFNFDESPESEAKSQDNDSSGEQWPKSLRMSRSSSSTEGESSWKERLNLDDSSGLEAKSQEEYSTGKQRTKRLRMSRSSMQMDAESLWEKMMNPDSPGSEAKSHEENSAKAQAKSKKSKFTKKRSWRSRSSKSTDDERTDEIVNLDDSFGSDAKKLVGNSVRKERKKIYVSQDYNSVDKHASKKIPDIFGSETKSYEENSTVKLAFEPKTPWEFSDKSPTMSQSSEESDLISKIKNEIVISMLPAISEADSSDNSVFVSDDSSTWSDELQITDPILPTAKYNLSPLSDSEDLSQEEDIVSTKKKIGFLGLGAMGQAIVFNLIKSGHNVTIWNRTPGKCPEFKEAGAHVAKKAVHVVKKCDITFCCVSDTKAARSLLKSVLKGLEDSCYPGKKGFVQLTLINPTNSRFMCGKIIAAGGRYLEAHIVGSSILAEKGELKLLCGGDRVLFHDCKSCLSAIAGEVHFFSPDIGNASTMNLIFQLFSGTLTAGLGEIVGFYKKFGFDSDIFMEIVEKAIPKPMADRVRAMLNGQFQTDVSLYHQQKVMEEGLNLAKSVHLHLPLAATAAQVFHCVDYASVYDYDINGITHGIKY